jgi:hypothetical protein
MLNLARPRDRKARQMGGCQALTAPNRRSAFDPQATATTDNPLP